jgi:LuxR family maltose regulon positive regulatory protein
MSADDAFDYSQRNLYTTLARVLVAEGKYEKALGLLARLQEADRARGRINHLIRLLVLQALAQQAQGDLDRALAALGEALSLAEPERYVWAFVREGQPMATLLREAAARRVATGYVNNLLATFRQKAAPPLPRSSALVEPLSDREREVLHLIADGLSNQDIADKLVIAVSTVKSHVNHILGKLDAKSRTQAVARARELDLL